MTLTKHVTKNIVRKLLHGEDYRIEIITLIDAAFLQYAIAFFRQVAEVKLKNQDITTDWYKQEMLGSEHSSEDIAIHSGLNRKTITNMYHSATREVVIDASCKHYDTLHKAIEELCKIEGLNLSLSITFNKVSVELDINESLIVINTLAVKRAALRGGLWSTAGKQVEGPLMETLCKLYKVSSSDYTAEPKAEKVKKGEVHREVDFFLHKGDRAYKCEVKLMGKGNPESADAVIARGSQLFVADKLSGKNKRQLDSLDVAWVALSDKHGYRRFQTALSHLGIAHQAFGGDLSTALRKILQ